jgi:hypothetical protein
MKKKCYEFSFFLESPYRIAKSQDPHLIVALLQRNALSLSEREFGENIPPPVVYRVRRCVQQPTLTLSLSMALQPFGPWPLFQLLNPIHSR